MLTKKILKQIIKEDWINQDTIKEVVGLLDLDLNYLLRVPIFKNYFNSKG